MRLFFNLKKKKSFDLADLRQLFESIFIFNIYVSI